MTSEMRIETIFEFVRFSVDDGLTEFKYHDDLDWEALYHFALKQTIIGVLYAGIEKMPKEHRPQKKLLMKWYAQTERIKSRNSQLNAAVVEVTRRFRDDGFPNCVLKGQGNALMYPRPELRSPGDIDLWPLAGREAIYKYVRRDFPGTEMLYHHLEYPIVKGIMTEVHFFPMFLNNPLYNRRFQNWLRTVGEEQCNNWAELPQGRFCRPTAAFNAVYQLAHIRHHFFDEGVGLRQLMDYYYLLKSGITSSQRDEIRRLLGRFGLSAFASAVMYAMGKVFGLDTRYMLAEPDAKVGEMVVEEILITGNFGKKDERYGDLKKTSRLRRLASLLQKNLHFCRHFPGEVFFAFTFRLTQPVWRWWTTVNYSK